MTVLLTLYFTLLTYLLYLLLFLVPLALSTDIADAETTQAEIPLQGTCRRKLRVALKSIFDEFESNTAICVSDSQ